MVRVLVLLNVIVFLGETLNSSLTVPLCASIHIPSPLGERRGEGGGGLCTCDDLALSGMSINSVSDIFLDTFCLYIFLFRYIFVDSSFLLVCYIFL